MFLPVSPIYSQTEYFIEGGAEVSGAVFAADALEGILAQGLEQILAGVQVDHLAGEIFRIVSHQEVVIGAPAQLAGGQRRDDGG